MPAYKDEERKTWYASFYYHDWTGEHKKKVKRGFKTKKEAQEWERFFLNVKAETLDIPFEQFVTLYEEDVRARVRENTWISKEYIINKKLIPYFGKKKMNEIKTSDIIKWQNNLVSMKDKNGRPLYSRSYLKTIQSQLSCIMNHAVRLYNLRKNPVHAAGSIGGDERSSLMGIWTVDEYRTFANAIMDEIEAYTAYEILYWGGLRLGELLALTSSDIDFENNEIYVTKSLQSIKGEVVITPPKTKKGTRVVKMPQFVIEEIDILIKMQYGLKPDERIFSLSKGYMHHVMDRGCDKSGVKRIRIHDIRHSHISMLIDMGFTAVDVANRVGHENIDITMHYAHMFPKKQFEIVNRLESMNTFSEVS